MEPLTVTRRTTMPADRREVWAHLSDAALLGAWLGAEVGVEVVPGACGTVTFDDGHERQIVVTHVEPERRVGFVWWDHAQPDQVSAVDLALDGDDGDGAVITVTETLDPTRASAGALGGRACLVSEAGTATGAAWGLRLGMLAADLSTPALV